MGVLTQFKLSAIIVTIGITVGAFAAHSLEDTLIENDLKAIKTASMYAICQGIAMLAVPSFAASMKIKIPKLFNSGLSVGTILFSGSILLLVLLKYQDIGYPKLLGLLTPVGGTILLISWFSLLWSKKESNE